MSFALRSKRPIKKEIRRLARKELGRAAECLDSDSNVSTVHTARKSVKKARSLLQLIRQTRSRRLRNDEKRLRAVGRAISTLRDAAAILDTFDHLRRRHAKQLPEHTCAIIRRELVRAKSRMESRARGERTLTRAAATLRKVRRSAKRWPIPSIEISDLPSLIKESFRESRKALKRADRTRRPPDVHRWRKRVKTLWYHLRLCESLAMGPGSHVRNLKQLETWLGEYQNVFVLRMSVARTPSLRRMKADVKELAAVAAASQEELRSKAFALGKRLFARKPKQYARYLRSTFSAVRKRDRPAPHHRTAAIA
jgi:CHAD domain-containing protein